MSVKDDVCKTNIQSDRSISNKEKTRAGVSASLTSYRKREDTSKQRDLGKEALIKLPSIRELFRRPNSGAKALSGPFSKT